MTTQWIESVEYDRTYSLTEDGERIYARNDEGDAILTRNVSIQGFRYYDDSGRFIREFRAPEAEPFFRADMQNGFVTVGTSAYGYYPTMADGPPTFLDAYWVWARIYAFAYDGYVINRPWNTDAETRNAKAWIDLIWQDALNTYNNNQGTSYVANAEFLGPDAQPNPYEYWSGRGSGGSMFTGMLKTFLPIVAIVAAPYLMSEFFAAESAVVESVAAESAVDFVGSDWAMGLESAMNPGLSLGESVASSLSEIAESVAEVPTPQYEAPQYEAPQYEAPQYEAPQYEAPQYEAPQYEAPQYEAPPDPGDIFPNVDESFNPPIEETPPSSSLDEWLRKLIPNTPTDIAKASLSVLPKLFTGSSPTTKAVVNQQAQSAPRTYATLPNGSYGNTLDNAGTYMPWIALAAVAAIALKGSKHG